MCIRDSIATDKDLETQKKNREKEQEIMKVFAQKIAEHKLEMKPIDIDCTFDGSKILFYFTAESRVDFRELVKDLASVYRTRIELRQIGVRDEEMCIRDSLNITRLPITPLSLALTATRRIKKVRPSSILPNGILKAYKNKSDRNTLSDFTLLKSRLLLNSHC